MILNQVLYKLREPMHVKKTFFLVNNKEQQQFFASSLR